MYICGIVKENIKIFIPEKMKKIPLKSRTRTEQCMVTIRKCNPLTAIATWELWPHAQDARARRGRGPGTARGNMLRTASSPPSSPKGLAFSGLPKADSTSCAKFVTYCWINDRSLIVCIFRIKKAGEKGWVSHTETMMTAKVWTRRVLMRNGHGCQGHRVIRTWGMVATN